MIRAGIIGGAGYTAGELVRLLVNHPAAEIAWIHSESQAGKAVAEHHPGLVGDTDLLFTDIIDLEGIDVLFLCSAHGKSRAFWEEHPCPAGLKVVDLAQDFRDESDGYVYGLPELNRDRILGADKVANPGCFATAIQLALLPLAKAGLLGNDVHVQAVTGSTGAGVKPQLPPKEGACHAMQGHMAPGSVRRGGKKHAQEPLLWYPEKDQVRQVFRFRTG